MNINLGKHRHPDLCDVSWFNGSLQLKFGMQWWLLVELSGTKKTWLHLRGLMAWYDLWFGVFYKKQSQEIYFLPVPCFGLVFQIQKDAVAEQQMSDAEFSDYDEGRTALEKYARQQQQQQQQHNGSGS